MDSFYTIVLFVALAMLLIILIGLGMMLQSQNKSIAFPLYATQCPDGWALDGSNCTVPLVDHPNFPYNPEEKNRAEMMVDLSNIVYTGSSKLYTISGKNLNFNPIGTTCQKRLWTNDYSVSWDGVSNYNKC